MRLHLLLTSTLRKTRLADACWCICASPSTFMMHHLNLCQFLKDDSAHQILYFYKLLFQPLFSTTFLQGRHISWIQLIHVIWLANWRKFPELIHVSPQLWPLWCLCCQSVRCFECLRSTRHCLGGALSIWSHFIPNNIFGGRKHLQTYFQIYKPRHQKIKDFCPQLVSDRARKSNAGGQTLVLTCWTTAHFFCSDIYVRFSCLSCILLTF